VTLLETTTRGGFAMQSGRRAFLIGAAVGPTLLSIAPAWAKGTYDEGATDTEIKLGNTNPYSGPASSYSTIGKCESAYWRMVNDRGGINGRNINFISLDDGYSPPKTVEIVRQLVEENRVLCCFNTLGTPTNTAVHKYLNHMKVPQLYVATGASKWGDPKHFPWTMGFQPDYRTEAIIYAKHVLANVKDPKVAVLYQHDDYGKDYWNGFKEGLGSKADLVVKETTYETTDPTVDSQVIELSGSGANVFFIVAIPKFAAQAIRKAADLNWRPTRYLNNVSSSVTVTMEPAGFDNSEGIITGLFLMDPTDKQWDDNAEMKTWRAFMAKYMPGANAADGNYVYAYAVSYMMEQTLKKCGDTLTRANLMKQAASFHNFKVPLLLPGITVSTSATDFYPIQAIRLARFTKGTWHLFDDVLSHESA
jgi:branched-chain amino acid transport system substrate-binding protein